MGQIKFPRNRTLCIIVLSVCNVKRMFFYVRLTSNTKDCILLMLLINIGKMGQEFKNSDRTFCIGPILQILSGSRTHKYGKIMVLENKSIANKSY